MTTREAQQQQADVVRALNPAVIYACTAEVAREFPHWTAAHCAQEAVARLLEPRETVADVIADLRGTAQTWKCEGVGTVNTTRMTASMIAADSLESWADRLERTQ